jgi:hypothetical protein
MYPAVEATQHVHQTNRATTSTVATTGSTTTNGLSDVGTELGQELVMLEVGDIGTELVLVSGAVRIGTGVVVCQGGRIEQEMRLIVGSELAPGVH